MMSAIWIGNDSTGGIRCATPALRALDRAGVARFGGINAPGYRYNTHDMVPQIVGGNALFHPVDMMMSIWNTPKLFSGDEHLSPHTLPYRPDERLP
jgi:hypothetical protein